MIIINNNDLYMLDYDNAIDITPTHASYYTPSTNGIISMRGKTVDKQVFGIMDIDYGFGNVSSVYTIFNVHISVPVNKGRTYQFITNEATIAYCKFIPFK